ARDVFQQRRFDGLGVVAFLHDRARRSRDLAAFRLNGAKREIAPPSCHDAELAVLGPHDERLQDALGADARQNVGNIRLRVAVAHVAFGDFELAEFDVLKFHDGLLLRWSGPALSVGFALRGRGRVGAGCTYSAASAVGISASRGSRNARRKSVALLAWLAA